MNEFSKYFEKSNQPSKKFSKKDINNNTSTNKKNEKLTRELNSILSNNIKDIAPIMPVFSINDGYKKNNLKLKPSRKWILSEFKNRARSDDLQLRHWVRIPENQNEYPFIKFNKHTEKVEITEDDFKFYIEDCIPDWTYEKVKIFLDLCWQYDLRFHVVYDRIPFRDKSLEELKDCYYWITSILKKTNNPKFEFINMPLPFDMNNEQKRKKQLELFYSRTPEQIEEQMNLYNIMKKIEQKKIERSKNNGGIDNLINSAIKSNHSNNYLDYSYEENSPSDTLNYSLDSTSLKSSQKNINKQKHVSSNKFNTSGSEGLPSKKSSIKSIDIKATGTYLRSIKTKVPINVGNKKSKYIEQTLAELSIELYPIPNQQIVELFNQLRTTIMLSYELKQAIHNAECEFQTLRHQYLTIYNEEPNFG